MNITKNVIIDLLPLYNEKEASEDSVILIETYLKEHPEFAKELASSEEIKLELPLTTENELTTLKKTKQLLKLRSFLFGSALFFSIIPFSFGDLSWSEIEGPHWLWINFPEGATISIALGSIAWIAYFRLKKHLAVTDL